MQLSEAIHRVAVHRRSLSREEARALMSEILSGQYSEPLIAAFLVALSMKGETVEEITGFAEAIRADAVSLKLNSAPGVDVGGTGREALVDTCGTGGDASGTFNISTASAFVAAGAGLRVAKHGNRGASSKCGSADVMEALGININLPPERLPACIDETGMVFLYAPAMHSAMKRVQSVRRELKMRTVFNLLGPLTNPANASAQVVGVYSPDLVEKLAQALAALGVRRAMVVHGADGLDEITTTAATTIAEVRQGDIKTYQVTPENLNLKRSAIEDLAGGDAKENSVIIRDILAGKKSARRDIVLANSAAALVVGGKAGQLRDGIAMAAQSIDSGWAAKKLESLVAFTNA